MVVFAIALIVVLTTFRLNHPLTTVVMMAAREHGNPSLFVLTSLAGTTLVLMLGMLLRNNQLLCKVGRNALLLLGLNGLFFHYINPTLEGFLTLPDSELVVALAALVVTALSIMLCMPFAHLIDLYLPQLVGKTRSVGPWLPAFEKPQLR
jgi:fucose 4-O-acetylase-like acetyltransferase